MSQELDQAVEGLKRSVLFELSLASKELFHSNFLAWLCKTYPEHAGRMFAAFLPYTPSSFEGLRVFREWHNTDVRLIYPDGGVLLIENKVKSLPVKRQLEELVRKAQSKNRTGFLLLSLTRPIFLCSHEATIPPSDSIVWQWLSYGKLATLLSGLLPQVADTQGYHGQILHDYVDFITHLDDLQRRFTIDWDNEQESFLIANADVKCLKSIRLHDLIDKMRYSQLEQRVGDALRADGFPVTHRKLHSGHDGEPGSVLVSTDMTRGVGLLDLKYIMVNGAPLGNPMILGVQVQGDHFRLVVEGRHKAREVARALWQQGGDGRLWFDFALLPDGAEEYPRNREFNQYSGIFFYRSKRLSSISPRRLVDTIVAYARSIRTNHDAIRQRIESVLQDGANHGP